MTDAGSRHAGSLGRLGTGRFDPSGAVGLHRLGMLRATDSSHSSCILLGPNRRPVRPKPWRPQRRGSLAGSESSHFSESSTCLSEGRYDPGRRCHSDRDRRCQGGPELRVRVRVVTLSRSDSELGRRGRRSPVGPGGSCRSYFGHTSTGWCLSTELRDLSVPGHKKPWHGRRGRPGHGSRSPAARRARRNAGAGPKIKIWHKIRC
jgi:hypothetical protein